MSDPATSSQPARLQLLAEPLRHRIYRYVVLREEAVSRDEAASAVGIQRGLAAFHLDKLADGGLLDVSFRRRSPGDGPGAGRPAKLYQANTEYHVSVPQRDYRLAATVLAAAAEELGGDATVYRCARDRGTADGEQAPRDLTKALAEHGFEPYPDGDTVLLGNCPFRALQGEFPALTCGMNHAYLQGFVAAVTGSDRKAVHLDPAAGRCCVAITS